MRTEKELKKLVDCPYCLEMRQKGFRIAAHIYAAHPEKVEEWIKNE